MRLIAYSVFAVFAFVIPNPGSPGPSAQGAENLASIGASLFELGQDGSGGTTYAAHGYAGANIKMADAGKPDTKAPGGAAGTPPTTGSTGEFSFRIKDYCIAAAEALVVPLVLGGAEPGKPSNSDSPFFVTGVKVDVEEQQKESCTFQVKVTYGISLPPTAKLTQVGYTVFLSGKKRAQDSKPQMLPRAPL